MVGFRLILSLCFVSILSGCIAQLPWAATEKVERAIYSHSGPSTISLMTVVAKDGSAGHSSLLINGSQRVIYDPAGTWYNFDVPERADLLYGITPKMLSYYEDYHAREGFHIVVQTKTVSSATADGLIQRAIANGASFSGMCASNTSKLLAGTPGFEGFPVGLFPKAAVAGFAAVPGVTTHKIVQHDEGKELK